MSTHSVAEAKNKLPELIDRALKGEGIVITRHGHPVVELRPVSPPERRITRRGYRMAEKAQGWRPAGTHRRRNFSLHYAR